MFLIKTLEETLTPQLKDMVTAYGERQWAAQMQERPAQRLDPISEQLRFLGIR